MIKKEETTKISNLTIEELYAYYKIADIRLNYVDNMLQSVTGSYTGNIFNETRDKYEVEKHKIFEKCDLLMEEIKKRVDNLE